MTKRKETLGERVRRLRTAQNLSQRELASQGVSYAYISRIEAGTRQPSVTALRMLAPKLGVSVEYLETGVHGPIDYIHEFAEALQTISMDIDILTTWAEVSRASDGGPLTQRLDEINERLRRTTDDLRSLAPKPSEEEPG